MSSLVYLHPLAMLFVVGLSVYVLREGLRIRRARVRGEPFSAGRHRRFARWVVVGVALGFPAGLVSMNTLRELPIAQSVHFPFVSIAALCVLAAYVLGKKLESGASMTTRQIHAAAGALGVLFALAAAVAGWAILP